MHLLVTRVKGRISSTIGGLQQGVQFVSVVFADQKLKPRWPALQAAASAASHTVQELQDKLGKAQDDLSALQAKVTSGITCPACCLQQR